MKIYYFIILVFFPLFALSQSRQSDEYYNKGVALYKVGKYKDAIPYFEKSNELDMQELDEGSNRREYSLHWLANCYYKLGSEEMAAELYPYEYRVPPVDRRLTVESDALADKVAVAYENEDYNTAIGYLNQMLQIEKAAEGENHPWVANDYLMLGCCHLYTGNYADAEKYTKLYVNIYENNYGTNSVQYARAMYELSIFHSNKHDYVNAIDCCNKSIKLYGEFLGKNTLEYTQGLNMLAICYASTQQYEKAVKTQQEHLALMRKTPGLGEEDYITSAGNLALYLNYAGRIGDALKQYNIILSRVEKLNGKNSALYALTLSDMAQVYAQSGNIFKAIELEQQALSTLAKDYVGSEEHIRSLMHFFEYYIGIGGTTDAKNYILQAYNILNNNKAEKTSQLYLDVMDFVVIAYYETGDIQTAIKYEEEKLKIFEQKFGKSSADYINAYIDFAVIRGDMGDYDFAVSNIEKNIETLQKEKIPIDPRTYNNLADIYQAKSDLLNANKYYRKAMDSFYSNKDTASYLKTASDIAMNKYYMGNWDEAFNYINDSINTQWFIDIINDQVKNKNAKHLGEYLSFAKNYKILLHKWMRLTSNNPVSKKSQFWTTSAELITMFDNMILEYYANARGEDNHDYINELFQVSLDKLYMDDTTFAEKNIPIWFDWTTKYVRNNFATMTTQERFHFQKMYSSNIGEELLTFAHKTQKTKFASIAYDGQLFIKGITLNAELEIQKLIAKSGNRQLQDKYMSIRNNRTILDNLNKIPIGHRTINTDSLQKIIEEQEKTLLTSSKEIGDYTKNLSLTWLQVKSKLKNDDIAIECGNFYDDYGDILYGALILKKNMSTPEMVTLFPDSLLTEIPPDDYYKTHQLYDLIWLPLQKYLDGVKNVYFSPCGKFHTIGIEYLPDDNGEIFAKKYNVYRLSSTRELALETEINPNKKASVYGGIFYDFSEDDWQELKKLKDEIEQEFRDIPDLSGSFRAGVTFLQGAKVESETITDILRNGNYQVSDWAESYATEESFKKLSGSGIKMLHIATHGFYEPESKQNSFTDFLSGSKNNKEDLSLSRSGLLLAGAASAIDPEKRKQIPEGVDDGILTAKEISRLDFKGLDLVVLSACQTGLGEVTSEGVFGLQRGFKKAGARTIVMSLWKVDDNATKDLMTEFYKNLVQCKSKHEAFVLAQDFVRQKYQDPQKWAAFIMVDGL